MATTFQNMFPSLNIPTVWERARVMIDSIKIKACDVKRVVLIHFDAEDETVQLRHYAISMSDLLTRSIQQLNHTQLPDLNHLEDISDFILW